MAKKNVSIEKVSKTAAIQKMEPWEEELALRAKDEQATETLGVPRITHRGSILKIDDRPVAGNKLRGVIVCYGLVKTYFENAFDPDAPAATPVCYAFAEAKPGAEAEMVPHEAAPDKQHERCQGCPHNAFGTGKGRGKRCQDKRRVFMIVETKDKNSVLQAQVRQIEVPPGSLRNWGNYLKAVKEVTPVGLRGVITEIGTEPLEKGAYTLTFSPVDKLDREFVKVIVEKEKQVAKDLFIPFPVLTQDEKPKGKARKIKGQD